VSGHAHVTVPAPSKRKLADAKRDLALVALVTARRSGLASDDAAARVACAEWCTAEMAAGRVP
jgi:hypothetical protein